MARDTLNADVYEFSDAYWLHNVQEEFCYASSLDYMLVHGFNYDIYTGPTSLFFIAEEEFKLPKEFME